VVINEFKEIFKFFINFGDLVLTRDHELKIQKVQIPLTLKEFPIVLIKRDSYPYQTFSIMF